MSTHIFISYSHSDTEFASRLTKDLKLAGYEIWFDRNDIQTGTRWDDEIVKGLNASEIFLVLLSNKSISSQNVKDEIGYAMDHNKQILPIQLETCEIPFRLSRVQYVDFTALKYGEGIQSVLNIIKSFITKGEKVETSGTPVEASKNKSVVETKKREEKNIMPRGKSRTSKNASGDKFTISITGNGNAAAVGRGARAVVNPGNSHLELDEWRKQMEQKINGLKDIHPEDKSTLNQQIQQIANEVEKGPQADASRVERLINIIAAMAPDIFEVTIATLLNPLAGIGLVVRKIGDKVQVQKAQAS